MKFPTREQLKSWDKEALITVILGQQETIVEQQNLLKEASVVLGDAINTLESVKEYVK